MFGPTKVHPDDYPRLRATLATVVADLAAAQPPDSPNAVERTSKIELDGVIRVLSGVANHDATTSTEPGVGVTPRWMPVVMTVLVVVTTSRFGSSVQVCLVERRVHAKEEAASAYRTHAALALIGLSETRPEGKAESWSCDQPPVDPGLPSDLPYMVPVFR